MPKTGRMSRTASVTAGDPKNVFGSQRAPKTMHKFFRASNTNSEWSLGGGKSGKLDDPNMYSIEMIVRKMDTYKDC